MQNKSTGMVRVTIVGAVLVVLLIGGAGIMGYRGVGMDSEMLNGIGATISAIVLASIIGTDALFVVLIARTPHRRWQP